MNIIDSAREIFEFFVISGWYTISFTNTNSAGGTAYSSNGGAESTPTILVNTSDGTPEQIATAVAAYINAQLSTKLSATVPTNGGKKTQDTGAIVDANTLVIEFPLIFL